MLLQVHGQLSERECALVMFQCLQVMSLNVQLSSMLAPYFTQVCFVFQCVLCCESPKWSAGMHVISSSLLHPISAVGPLLDARKSLTSMPGQTKCMQI